MMKRYMFILIFFACPVLAAAQTTQHSYTLNEIIGVAKNNSIDYKIAQSNKENSYFQFTDYKASLKPQLSLTGNLLNYNKDYFGVYQPDGKLIFLPRTQNYSSLQVGLTQSIELTGGTFSFNSIVTRFDDFVGSTRQYNGIPFNIQLNQPIWGFNQFKWQRRIEPLKLQESEKKYQRDVEDIAHQACLYYFDVLDANQNLLLAQKNLVSQSAIYKMELQRVDLGTTTREKILQLKLSVLNHEQELKSARVLLKKSLFALKTFIGLKDSLNSLFTLPTELPDVNISIEQALDLAKKNRAEYIAFRRQKLEAERDLEQAKKQNFTVNLVGALGFNNIGNTFLDVYKSPKPQQSASIGIQIPVLDWGRRKGRETLARNNLKTIEYTIEQEEQSMSLQIINLVQNLTLIRSNIETSKQAALIAEERYELSEQQLRLGKLSLTDFNISLQEKDEAQRGYVTSLRNFWDSYYQLRTLILAD